MIALVGMRATSLAARLILLFLIARHSPPAEFGLVVFALSVAEIARVLADFGLDTLAIREYAPDAPPGAHARFAASLLGAKAAFGVMAYAITALWFALTRPPDQAAIGWIVGAMIFTGLLAGFSIDWFQARLRVNRVIVPVVVVNAVLILVAMLLVPRLPDVRARAVLFPAFEAVIAIMLLIAFARERVAPRLVVAFDQVPQMVRSALPIAATAVLIMLYSRLDVLVLSSRLGVEAVGQYGLAFRFTEPVQMAAAAFGLTVFSRFAAWFRNPPAETLRPAVLRYVGYTLAYGVTAAAALAVLAPPIIARWLPAYTPAIPVLRLLAAALVFRSMNATLAGILQGAGRFRLIGGFALWNLAFMWICLRLLVPSLGAVGAALALLTVEGVNTLFQSVMVARVTGGTSVAVPLSGGGSDAG
jgi:O-antigen/teichoic acid export membrane protein